VTVRAARVLELAHGGQALLSGAAADLVAGRLPEGVWLADLGCHRLADLARRCACGERVTDKDLAMFAIADLADSCRGSACGMLALCRQGRSSFWPGTVAAASQGTGRDGDGFFDIVGRWTWRGSAGILAGVAGPLHPAERPRFDRRVKFQCPGSNSTGKVRGPLMPSTGFHGAGPVRRMFGMRPAMATSATASSAFARCTPRQ